MNKLELIATLKNEAGISKAEAAKVVEIFFGNMADALAEGERVEIRGLGSFFGSIDAIKQLEPRFVFKGGLIKSNLILFQQLIFFDKIKQQRFLVHTH